MKLKGLMAAALAVGVMSTASTASAAILDLTYTGTVSAGFDIDNDFGGGDLTGDAFTSFYSFNTSILYDVSPSGSEFIGGTYDGDDSSASQSSLTIDGHIFKSDGYNAGAEADPEEFVESFASTAAGYEFYDIAYSPFSPTSLLQNLYITSSIGNSGEFFDPNFGEYVYLSDKTLTVTVDGVSAAPEPSTWALMIVGIGGVGLALRRARRSAGFRVKPAVAA